MANGGTQTVAPRRGIGVLGMIFIGILLLGIAAAGYYVLYELPTSDSNQAAQTTAPAPGCENVANRRPDQPCPTQVGADNAAGQAASVARDQREAARTEASAAVDQEIAASVAATQRMRGGFRSEGGLERFSRRHPLCVGQMYCMQFTPGYDRAEVRAMGQFILSELQHPGRRTPPPQFLDWRHKTTETRDGVTITCTPLRETSVNDLTPEACFWQIPARWRRR